MSATLGLLRRVGVEPGERALFGWAALCLVLVGATAFALLNAAETLFLKRVGVVYLPWALLASAALQVVTTAALSRALSRVDRPAAVPRVFLGLALPLVPLWWLLHVSAAAPIFGAFVVLARQVLALGLLAFWLALSDLVTARQAKRLFVPLSAGITLGAIAGSFASDPIARWLDVEGLVLAGAVLLGTAALAATRLRRARSLPLERVAASRSRRVDAVAESVTPIALWRESALFRHLLGGVLCAGILSPVLYYEFSSLADAATQGGDGEQRLIGLLAQFRGWLNVALLGTQLGLSARVYRRIGLPLSLALWPASFVLGFGWLGVQPSLAAGLATMGASRLAEDGLGGSAQRVLYHLFPERLRSTAAGLLEGPASRLGSFVGNASVLAVLALGVTSTLAPAALPLAGLWLGFAVALWQAYPRLLVGASADRSLVGAGADTALLLDPGTVRSLAPALADPDTRRCRAAIELALQAETDLALEVLAEALERAPVPNRPLLVDALHRLTESAPKAAPRRAADAIARVLAEPEPLAAEDRADLLQSYARLTAGDAAGGSVRVLARALGDRAPAVRLAAVAELGRRGRPPAGAAPLDRVLRDSASGRDVGLRRTARKELRAMLLASEPDPVWDASLGLLADGLGRRADRAETAEALAEVARHHRGSARPAAERMLRLCDDRDPRVRAAVLRFAGHAGLSAHARRLTAGLSARNPQEAAAAREGLVALGAEATAPLLGEIEFGDAGRRDAAISLLRELEVDPAALQRLYVRILDRVRGMVVLRAALGAGAADTLVCRRLDERGAEGVGALLALVSVRADDQAIAELDRRLRRVSGERQRDLVIEALDAILPAQARADLMPLLEVAWAQPGHQAAPQLARRVPSRPEALAALQRDEDELTRRLARAFAPEAVEERRRIGDASGVVDPMDVALRLQAVPAFGRLSTPQLVRLAEVMERMRFAAGTLVYREGAEADGLYFVFDGEVEILRGDTVVERLGPGSFFGEVAALDGVPRLFSARAHADSQLLHLAREELLALMQDAPALGIGLSQHLSLRLRALQDRLGSR